MKKILFVLMVLNLNLSIVVAQKITFDKTQIIGYDDTFSDRHVTKITPESAQQYIIGKVEEVKSSGDSTNIYYRTGLISLCDEYLKKYKPVMLPDSTMDIVVALNYSSIEDIKVNILADRGSIKASFNDYRGALEDFSSAIKISRLDHTFVRRTSSLLRIRGFYYYNLNEVGSACKDWNEAVNLGDTDALTFVVKFCQIK